MIQKPNILIIGGSSFVAQNFIRLQQQNCTIKTISRTSTNYANELVIADFETIPETIFEGIDVVINCAAIVHQPKEVDYNLYETINYKLAVDLAKKAASNGVKSFVQLSTIAVYGKQTQVTKTSKEHPINPYGKTKLLADNELLKLSSSNFNVLIFRPPMIYGGANAPGNMMRLIKLISTGIPLPFKGISNKRDFIHIDNLIGFIDAGIKKNKSAIYLVSDNSPVLISELYVTITSSSNKSNNSFKLPNFCFSIIKKIVPGVYEKLFGNLTIDITETLQELDFSPKVMLEQGITEMITHSKNK